MKKKLMFMLICVMVLMLVGCSSQGNKNVANSKYIGKWKADSLSIAGETEPLESEINLELKGDGTALFYSGDEVTNCNWEETRDGFRLTGDAKLSFKEDGENVTAVILGVTMTFERVK